MSAATELLVLIDALDDQMFKAKPVPLTDQVRLDPTRLRTHIEKMRAAVSTALPERTPDAVEFLEVLEQLERIAHDAKPVPLTDQVRLDKETVYDLLDRMRMSLPFALRAQRGDRAREGSERSPVTVIALDEAARTLPELVERVKFGGERFQIEAHGIAMAELRPPPD